MWSADRWIAERQLQRLVREETYPLATAFPVLARALARKSNGRLVQALVVSQLPSAEMAENHISEGLMLIGLVMLGLTLRTRALHDMIAGCLVVKR